MENNATCLDNARNWKEDFEHENGMYMCICTRCKLDFIGHKRRLICKVCHENFPKDATTQVKPTPPASIGLKDGVSYEPLDGESKSYTRDEFIEHIKEMFHEDDVVIKWLIRAKCEHSTREIKGPTRP